MNLSDYLGKTPLYICVNNSIVHTAECKLAVQKLIHSGAIVDKLVHKSIWLTSQVKKLCNDVINVRI